MAPRDPEETSKMIRLEKAGVGINVVAALVLTITLALVADVRTSISTLVADVRSLIRDVSVLQSQNLDIHVRELERRMAIVEASQRGKNP